MNATIAHSGLSRRSLALGGEIVFERGSGGMVTDINGKEYVDFILGYGSVIIGHNVKSYHDRLQVYAQNGLLLPGYTSWHNLLISRLLNEHAKDYSVAFFKTASESVTAAARLATKLSFRKGIIRCGFIGWHDVQLGRSVRWHEPLESPLRYKLRFVDSYRGITGDEAVFNWTSLDLDELKSMIDSEVGRIGCIIIDTYQMRFADAAVLKEAIDFCRQNDIYVVADETKISGRVTGLGFAREYGWDVDFVIIGKALANGAPFSLLLGRPHLMAVSEEVRITGTFSQELGAVYSALATMEEMERRNGYAVIRQIGHRVVKEFNSAAEKSGIRHLLQAETLFNGEMFEVVFSKKMLDDWSVRQALCSALAERGILLLQGHPSYVCLEHQILNFDMLSQRFEQGLTEWRARLPPSYVS